jgi:hypothetical protein
VNLNEQIEVVTCDDERCKTVAITITAATTTEGRVREKKHRRPVNYAKGK